VGDWRRLKSVTTVSEASIDTSARHALGWGMRELGFDGAIVVFAIAVHQAGLIAFILGNGILFSLTAIRLRRWERRHDGVLLQAPGWPPQPKGLHRASTTGRNPRGRRATQ
jgi:hypothetical protein